jgi:hypothetical protein
VGAGEIDAAREPPQRWPDQTLKSNLLELAASVTMLNRGRMRSALCMLRETALHGRILVTEKIQRGAK